MSVMYRRFSFYLWLLTPLCGGLGLLWYLKTTGLLNPPGADVLPGAEGAAIGVVWWLSAAVLILGMALALVDIIRAFVETAGARALREGRDPRETRSLFFSLESSSAGRRYGELEALKTSIGDGLAVPADWLSTAHRRTSLELAPIGAATRAFAAMLLLLAVLGTFAGMREALPKLSDAIAGAGTAPQGDALTFNPSLSSALKSVGDAFGANLLALAGSVALGIAGFGVTRIRSSVLETIGSSLDARAGLIGREATGHDLHSAILAVEGAARNVASTARAIDGLGGKLDAFQARLAESLDRLGSNVSRTIQVQLEEKLAGTLAEVSTSLGAVASAVGATATAYEGMVAAVSERNTSSEREIETLRVAAEGATTALVAVQETARNSVNSLAASLSEAEISASRSISEHVDRLADATKRHSASLADETSLITKAADDAARSIDGTNQAVTTATAQLESTLTSLAGLQGELGGTLRDQVRAVQDLRISTEPVAERLDRAVAALEKAAQSTAQALAKAEAEIHAASLVNSSALADLATDLRSQSASSMQRLEQSAAQQAQANAAALGAAREAFAMAVDSFERTEARMLTSFEGLGSNFERAMRLPRAVDLSPRTIEALAEASRARRRLWPFGKRR